MKPLDPDLSSLLLGWIEKADADLEAAERLTPGIADAAEMLPGDEIRALDLAYLARRVVLQVVEIE